MLDHGLPSLIRWRAHWLEHENVRRGATVCDQWQEVPWLERLTSDVGRLETNFLNAFLLSN
jgi:hypothetical protein